jgi:hypothetical protein
VEFRAFRDNRATAVARRKNREKECLAKLAAIDWKIAMPLDYEYGIRLALREGAHAEARRLALEGAKRYSKVEELQRFARILAPPTVRIKK